VWFLCVTNAVTVNLGFTSPQAALTSVSLTLDSGHIRYPRIVGLTPQGKPGLSDKWYELLVVGKDRTGSLAKLTAILAEHDINLAPSGGYYLVTPDTFVWTTFANFTDAKSPPESVLKDLRRLDFVSSAEGVEVKNAALDEFLFPVVISGSYRGIIMSLSPLLKAEQRLTEMLGTSGDVLMFEEGKAYALECLAQLRASITDAEPEGFLKDVAAWLRTTGWGIITFDIARLATDGTVSVQVEDPPNAVIKGERESHFTNGVVAGIIEGVFKRKVRLELSRYEKPSTLRLGFRASK
jgi:predicted amino acid-binding ACT domain protein